MALDDMSAQHIAAKDGLFEPQRMNNGLLTIYGLAESKICTLAFENFPIPKFNLNPGEMNHLNGVRKYVSKVTIEDVQVVCQDYVDVGVLSILTDWFLDHFDPSTERIGLARNYKKNGEVALYGPNGGFERVWLIEGIMINNFDPGDIDHAGEGDKKINIGLSIDRCIPDTGLLIGSLSKITNDGTAGDTTALSQAGQ